MTEFRQNLLPLEPGETIIRRKCLICQKSIPADFLCDCENTPTTWGLRETPYNQLIVRLLL